MIKASYISSINRVKIECPFQEKDVVKDLGARWDKIEKYWYFPYPTYEIFKALKSNGVHFSSALQGLMDDLRYKEDTVKKIKMASPTDLPTFKEIKNLFAHQTKTVMFGRFRDSYADLSDCGTGKTISTLSVLKERIDKNPNYTVLVVAPKTIIMSGWVEDCAKIYPEISIVAAIGTKNQNLKAFQDDDANIYVTNYETLHQDFGFETAGIDCIVFDEAVKLKNPSAGWTKRAIKLSKVINDKIIISGLITPNNLLDIYAPFTILEPDILYKSFYQFKSKFFTPDPFSYMNKSMVPKKGAHDAIAKRIERLIIRHKKEDCLDLPDKTHIVREIPMTKEQQGYYNEMAKTFIVEIGDEKIRATSAGVKLQKLAQITSGFLYSNEEDVAMQQFHSAKTKELKHLLEGDLSNEQVIIFCNYKAEIHILRDMFPDSAFIYGGQTTSEQEHEIQSFKNNDKRILCANIKASKYGLTFTNCSTIIYFSMSYSLDDMYQSQERIHRIGQEKRCTYIYMLAKGSVDKRVLSAIKRKETLNQLILNIIEEMK